MPNNGILGADRNNRDGPCRIMTSEEINLLPYRPNVGIMLVNSDGHIFVAQRLDSPGPAWQMPQGGIDRGEAPQPAALRELEEETGITRDLVDIVCETADWLQYDFPHEIVPKVTKGKFRGQKQMWFLMRFLGDDRQINIATKHPEFSEWKWSDPEDLVANIVPFKRQVYALVLGEFSPYLEAN